MFGFRDTNLGKDNRGLISVARTNQLASQCALLYVAAPIPYYGLVRDAALACELI